MHSRRVGTSVIRLHVDLIHTGFFIIHNPFDPDLPGLGFHTEQLAQSAWRMMTEGIGDLSMGTLVQISGVEFDHHGIFGSVFHQANRVYRLIEDGRVIVDIQDGNDNQCGT
uniref:Uncharacterized protein n=1 Tax=Callorhinchus milii TaxID=7868 RepID=A0A4W3JD11_CALMI